jgi:coxsackievirus/adenovirus receptor
VTFFSVTDFDQQVQDSKYKAEDALRLVPEIRQQIADAENKTGDARQALAGAEHNAQIARDTAQEAQQKYAEQASHVRPHKCFMASLQARINSGPQVAMSL